MVKDWYAMKKWERKEYNAAYLERIWKEKTADIVHSIDNSRIFYDFSLPTVEQTQRKEKVYIKLEPKDTVQSLMENGPGDYEGVMENSKRICVLNFASYKKPGGGFIDGMTGQEEALCVQSILYPVLRYFAATYYSQNEKQMNKGLYLDHAIYSRDVLFTWNGRDAKVDVLTCAAPNWTVGQRYGKFTERENLEALSKRSDFLFRVAGYMNVDMFIVGAWGCGVFGQHPIDVAKCLITSAQTLATVPNVILAVPKDRGKNAMMNYEGFERVYASKVGF